MVLFLPSESSQGVNGSFQTRVDAAAPGVVLAGLAVCANSGMPAKSITTPQCNPWLTTGFMASHLSRRHVLGEVSDLNLRLAHRTLLLPRIQRIRRRAGRSEIMSGSHRAFGRT